MKKIIFVAPLFLILAAGCASSPSTPQNSITPQAATGAIANNQAATNSINNKTTPMSQQTNDSTSLQAALLSSYNALSSSFDTWIITTGQAKADFIQNLAYTPQYKGKTVDQVWSEVAQFYKTTLYPDPNKCSYVDSLIENYQGADYAVYYCNYNGKAYGITFIKNAEQSWVITGIYDAEKDANGKVVTGGTGFTDNDSPNTHYTKVYRKLEQIFQDSKL